MKLKQKIIIGLLCLLYSNSWAQITIHGQIINEENEKIAGVSIFFTELNSGTISEKNGAYTFKLLKNGIYTVEISLNGYKSQIHRIEIKKDTNINFIISESVSEFTEVIVTGVNRSTELKLNPIIVKTIGSNDLFQNNSTNIVDGLKNIPGVNQISTGVAISKPIIRGLGYNRVITLNNGIRQEGQQWGDEHGIEIDEYSIDRVEIIKGPGSLMYGSDGIAGVINFLSPKAPPTGVVRSKIETNYQSNNHFIGNSVSNEGNKNGIQWLGRISQKLAGNYQNAADGRVLNSGFNEYNCNVQVGLNKHWGYTQWMFNSFNQILNLVEGNRDSLGNFTYSNSNGNQVTAQNVDYKGYQIGIPHQQINHFKLAVNQYFILKSGSFNSDLGYQNNQRKEFGDPLNPKKNDLYFDLSTFNYSFRYNLIKMKGWESTIGLGGMLQQSLNKGTKFIIPNYRLFDMGVFISTQKNFKKFTIAQGIRLDQRNSITDALYLDTFGFPTYPSQANGKLKFQSFEKKFVGVSGSIGFSYQIRKKNLVKFNLSRGFRAPNISELSSNGRHEGTFRFEIGNANLKSEISHQIDIGYYYKSDHVSLEVTPFINFIHNYIYAKKLMAISGGDSILDSNNPCPAYKFNSGNAALWGGEIFIDIHPHPLDWLHVENGFSFVQANQLNQPDSTRYLPFIPSPKYRSELKANFKQVGKWFSNVFVKFSLDYNFRQDKFYRAFETETFTPAYSLLNFGLGGTLKTFKKADCMQFVLLCDNLTNVAYQSHLSRLKYAPINQLTGKMGVFNMGRNISLKLIFTL